VAVLDVFVRSVPGRWFSRAGARRYPAAVMLATAARPSTSDQAAGTPPECSTRAFDPLKCGDVPSVVLYDLPHPGPDRPDRPVRARRRRSCADCVDWRAGARWSALAGEQLL